MPHHPVKVLLILMYVGLTACQQRGKSDICSTAPPLTGKPIATATEQAQAMEACIHRWAIRLARAPGPNREIADAVLAGCAEPITLTPHMYRQEKNDDLADEAYWTSRATKLALFHVVQARAGDCPLPNE